MTAQPRNLYEDAKNYYQQGLERVKETPYPKGQKYPPGTRVWITKNMPKWMSHFTRGCWGTVRYTYAHAYPIHADINSEEYKHDITQYCIDIDNHGEHAWYYECQLTSEIPFLEQLPERCVDIVNKAADLLEKEEGLTVNQIIEIIEIIQRLYKKDKKD
jgi:hypothetical protein